MVHKVKPVTVNTYNPREFERTIYRGEVSIVKTCTINSIPLATLKQATSCSTVLMLKEKVIE